MSAREVGIEPGRPKVGVSFREEGGGEEGGMGGVVDILDDLLKGRVLPVLGRFCLWVGSIG